MSLTKSLVFCGLMVALINFKGYSQNCPIEVSTSIIEAQPGKADGKVTFEINGNQSIDSRYIIFDITANREGQQNRVVVKGNAVSDLKKGIYEFLVVDKGREKCFKEFQVEIKETTEK